METLHQVPVVMPFGTRLMLSVELHTVYGGMMQIMANGVTHAYTFYNITLWFILNDSKR